ncbi:hypothetical protein Q9233_001530, partial [Columba guinea]
TPLGSYARNVNLAGVLSILFRHRSRHRELEWKLKLNLHYFLDPLVFRHCERHSEHGTVLHLGTAVEGNGMLNLALLTSHNMFVELPVLGHCPAWQR